MDTTSGSRHFDVVNGDADGLCALHQLRLAEPRKACLITGVKRDNALLDRVKAQRGDSVTVLDLPLPANLDALLALLEQGVAVDYFDHHHAPELPVHPLLRLTIDPAPDVCTSILVNRHVPDRFGGWAVVGAFGDNMPATANRLAVSLGLNEDHRKRLKTLGESLNYNAYGDSEADLMIPPANLYRLLAPYPDPLDFLANEAIHLELARQRNNDLKLAMEVTPLLETDRLTVILLPAAAWARRVIGSFANWRASQDPARVHAILAANAQGALTVSLRVPAGGALSASRIAQRFGGNGRSTAAGVNNLPPGEVAGFVRDLRWAVEGGG